MATAKPAYEKRPYQEACQRALRAAFRGGAKFALFVLATGLGKTFVAVKFLRWLLGEIAPEAERRPRVLVLCHQKPILRQLVKTFAEFLGDGYTCAVYRPGRKKAPPPEVDFLFATFHTMLSRKSLLGRRHFDVLLVDEGHHSAADSYAATIRYFDARFRVAMTATPNRLDLRDIRQLFGPEVYSKPLAEALAEGLLPRVIYKYFLESGDRLPSNVLKGQRPTRKLLDRRFFKARGTPARDKKIADEITAEMRRLARPRALVFCQTIADCDRMTTYLVERGVRAATVHSKVDDDEQENRLEALRAGELEAIVARDVLNEGKDIPELNLVAIVRSTASRTIFEQQIGRGLRPGKEALTVLDFVANCDRIQNLAAMVAAVRKAKKKGGCNVPTDVDDDDATVCVLEEDEPDLPFDVRAGNVRFEVVYKDLLEVLGRTKWTLESGMEALRAEARRLGKNTLVTGDIEAGSPAGRCPSWSWVTMHLAPKTGGLAEALETLGLEPSGWTVESGKEALQALAERLGKKTLTLADMDAGSAEGVSPGRGWALKYLAPKTGKMPELLKALGLEEPGWTDKTAKAALVALAKRHGKKTLTQADIDRGSKAGECPSSTWVTRIFAPNTGSLPEAMESLGLEPRGWTVETGRAALLALAKRLGRLTVPDITEGCKRNECPSDGWVRKHLLPNGGGIRELRTALGLDAE